MKSKQETKGDFDKQNEALIPREVLAPLYEKFMKESTKYSAEDFYFFLLKQLKT